MTQRISNGPEAVTKMGSTPAVWFATTISGPGEGEAGMCSRPETRRSWKNRA